MRRLFVLCVIFLSILSFPGNASAISGEVWSTDAYNFALDPSIGPPKDLKPDATFEVESINFDSGRIQDSTERSQITYAQFLNNPTKWNNTSNPALSLLPDSMLFATSDLDQGIFFRFTWVLPLSKGSNPFTIVHDDGFFLYLSNGISFDFSGQFGEPKSSKVDLEVNNSENYTLQLDYGALNDTYSQVLIVRTPEPGSMLLLALGILGIGILRRRH